MIFEYMDLTDGKLNFTSVDDDIEGFSKIENVNLTEAHDKFYAKNMMKSLYEVIEDNKKRYAELEKDNPNLEEIDLEGMKEVLDKLPELKRLRKDAKKHFDIGKFLSQCIVSYKLSQFMAAESTLLTSTDGEEVFKLVRQAVNLPKARNLDRIRLALFFSLKFCEKKNMIYAICEDLKKRGVESVRPNSYF